MGFQSEIYKIENKARKYITKLLDKKERIKLYKEEGDLDDDEKLCYYPQQSLIGKHDNTFYYYIIEVYKERDNYCAVGIDNGEEYHFDLYSEVDSNVIAQIADLIKSYKIKI